MFKFEKSSYFFKNVKEKEKINIILTYKKLKVELPI
jgi:hypothetical protein